MNKTNNLIAPAYYLRYIDLVPENDVVEALYARLHEIKELNTASWKKLGDKVYAPGKWTICDILQHLVDAERVMSYRAMRFARADKTPLSGYNDEDWAKNAQAPRRGIDEIISEMIALRNATILLFKSFLPEDLGRSGPANNNEISVLALGFIIAGHQMHHFNVIQEKYMPLL